MDELSPDLQTLLATGIPRVKEAIESNLVERVGQVWIVWPPKDSKGEGVALVAVDGSVARYSVSGDWRGESGYRELARSGQWLTDPRLLRLGLPGDRPAEPTPDPLDEAIAVYLKWRDGGGRERGEPMPTPPVRQ